MNLPALEEYLEFHKATTYKSLAQDFSYMKVHYQKFLKQFSTIEEVFDQNLETVKQYSNFIIYFALKYEIVVPQEFLTIHLVNAESIIIFFNPGKEEFFEKCNKSLKHSRWSLRFYPLLVRAMMFLGKSDIDKITYQDMESLFCEDFLKVGTYSKGFITYLEHIHGLYTGKPSPKPYRTKLKNGKDDISEYGSGHEELLHALKTYLDEEYIQVEIQIANPLKNLKTFMEWLYINHYNVTSFKMVNRNYWQDYKKYIQLEYKKPSTRRNKLISCVKFLKWLYQNNHTENAIVYAEENIGISNSEVYESTESRHFKDREQFKILLAKVYSLKPQNEKEELFIHLILIASATGFRLNEVLWLGPDCITETSGDVGEVVLQINEKQGVRNKPTSILPWGLESIRFLEKRFKEKNRDKKPNIFYHEKSKLYLPSLFELDGEMLTVNMANMEINKIISELESELEGGGLFFKKGSKFHGFRHQKFNDIGEVTGGSTSAVQMDSYHQNTAMVVRYLEQTKAKRQEEAYKALEEGKIVGKGAEILRLLLQTPYAPEAYMEIVKKMNIATHVRKEELKEVMKFLGFGYCSAKICKVKPICEGCDYFWSCSSFSDALAERYAINFTLVKAHEIDLLSSDGEFSLITSLKYQEKWLVELGYDQKKIEELRTKFIEGWS